MLRAQPGFAPMLNRRRVLSGGAALAGLAVAASGCASPPAPPAVDELESQLTLAHHDSDLASAAAVGVSQQLSAALTQVAAERAQHAQALSAEIKRLAPTSSSATSPTPTTSAAVAPPPPLAAVVTSLTSSATSASRLASTASGYRAGLLASIAASCTAAYSVALAFGATPS